ncbi:MAG: phosphotransferase, partial [Rhodoglobus sp.]|nr:phosphotransferase [Rhodoglobus sp.]
APVALERPGASNMNCVWRVRLPGRSLILKQARPWVEKYPALAAPVERTETEARFYRLASLDARLAARLPAVIDHDATAHVLVLADLAPATCLEMCYAGNSRLTATQLDDIAATVNRLHRISLSATEAPRLRNHAMRTLNHAHVFGLPLRADGPFDAFLDSVTPGLAGLSRELRADAAYVSRVTALGHRYLDHDHPHLIHGDLFLGSLLRAPGGEIMLIDPEFSFGGEPEFDLGVFYAHLILSGHDDTILARWLAQTVATAGRDATLTRQYAGGEIMRRLIGVAQLPLTLDLPAKAALLGRSRELVG